MKPSSTAPYTQVRQFTVNLGRQQLECVTKPGLPSWNQAWPSSQLFIDNAIVQPSDRLLLFGCHLGSLAVSLTNTYPNLQISISDHNQTALEMTRLTLAANHNSSVTILENIGLPQELSGLFDIIFIQLPKGRSLARRWLVQAYQGLAVGGSVYLAGANEAGIHSVIKDAQGLFSNGRVVAYKKGNRLAQFIKQPGDTPQPEWVRSPGISPGTWVEFPVNLSNVPFTVHSLPGVFSCDHLDEGTQMLLDSTNLLPAVHVLDVGCGYGAIGLFASVHGAGSIHLVDNDLLAIASCAETLALNVVPNARVFTGDLLYPVQANKYDLILSNPPFHAGRSVNYQVAEALISQSFRALNPGGRLMIVTNRFIRYDQLIDSVFGNIHTVAESNRFRVLSGLKSGA